MYEIKILRGADSEVQKTLNQWKHEYTLRIQGFHPTPSGEGVVVMLLRIKKEK